MIEKYIVEIDACPCCGSREIASKGISEQQAKMICCNCEYEFNFPVKVIERKDK